MQIKTLSDIANNSKKYALAWELDKNDYKRRYLLTTQLDSLLHRSHELEEDTFGLYAENGMTIHDGTFIVAAFTADMESSGTRYSFGESTGVRSAIYEDLACLVYEDLMYNCISYTANIDGIIVSLVCHRGRCDQSAMYALLSECAERIIEDALTRYGITASAVISGAVMGRKQIAHAYAQVRRVLKFREFWPEATSPIAFAGSDTEDSYVSVFSRLIESSVRFCQLASGNDRDATIDEAFVALDFVRLSQPVTRLRLLSEMRGYFDLVYNRLMQQHLICAKNARAFKTQTFFSSRSMADLETEVKTVAGLFFDSTRRIGKHSTLGRISAVKEYIYENITDSRLTVSSLAERFSLSQPLLSAQFKKYTGETICGHISRLRVEKARQLLSDTSLTLPEISARTGFGSAVSLHRAFKKHLGASPGIYRK